MASTPVSASTGSTGPTIPTLPSTPEAVKALVHMDRLRWACNVAVITTLALFVLTIVLIGLASGRILLPSAPIYSLATCFGTICVTIALDKVMKSIGEKAGIKAKDYIRNRQPPPPKEPKEPKESKSKKSKKTKDKTT